MIVASIKQLISSFKKSYLAFIITFVIFPVVFALILSSTQEEMFSGKIDFKATKIEIVDNDNSDYSKAIKDIFKNKEIEKYYKISKDPDFKIVIPENFEKNLLDNKINIKVETLSEKASIYELEYIKEFLKSIGDSILVTENNNKIISTVNNEELAKEIEEKLYSIQQGNTVENIKIEPENKISSKIYSSITFMQFIFINYLMTMAVDAKKLSETTSLEMRVELLPVNKVKLNIVTALSNGLFVFIFTLMYIVIVNLLGMAFQDNIIQYIVASFIISITVGFISLLLGNIKKEFAIIIMYFVLGIQMILGGMIGPVGKLFGGTFIESLSNINFNKIFSKPLMDVFNNSLSIKTFIPHIAVSLICLLIGIVIIKIDNKKRVGA